MKDKIYKLGWENWDVHGDETVKASLFKLHNLTGVRTAQFGENVKFWVLWYQVSQLHLWLML